MSRTILSLVILGLGPLLLAQSYEKLEGRRLAQLLKTAGASESGRAVLLHLPAAALASAEITKAPVPGRRSFRWKKLRVEVEDGNPYWRQTLRKLDRDAKGTIVLKGRVRWRRDAEGGRDHYLLLDSIQKTTRRR